MINSICSTINIGKISNNKRLSFKGLEAPIDTFSRTTKADSGYEVAKNKIIKAIIDTNTEYGIILSPDGEIIDEDQGSEHKCTVRSDKVVPNSRLMHGHPKPLPLSSGDIACLLATDAKSEEAITRDGKYSRLIKQTPFKSPLSYQELYLNLEKTLCLKALDKLGIDYKFNTHDLATMFKDYLNYQTGENPDNITDEEALAKMPTYGIDSNEENLDEAYKKLKELMYYQLMFDPYKYDKEHNAIMDNYALVNSFLDTKEGIGTRIEFIKDIAEEYNLEYESNL